MQEHRRTDLPLVLAVLDVPQNVYNIVGLAAADLQGAPGKK
jgi:hypothetical protein